MTSLAVITSYPLTVLGSHTLIHSFVSPIIFFLTAIYAKHSRTLEVAESQNKSSSMNRLIVLFLVGIGLGLTCYIRIDSTLTIVCLLFTVVTFNGSQSKDWISIENLKSITKNNGIVSIGVASAVVLCGWDDRQMYGEWFSSPIQWINFNIISGNSAAIFGSKQNGEYLVQLITIDRLTTAKIFIIITYFISYVCTENVWKLHPKLNIESHTDNSSYNKEVRHSIHKFSAILTFLISCFSTVGHKELRFLHDVFIFIDICAIAVVFLVYKKYAIKHNITRHRIISTSNIYKTNLFNLSNSKSTKKTLISNILDILKRTLQDIKNI